MKPRLIESQTSGPRPRLTLRDRVQIDIGVKTDESLNSIGRRLDRPASTIMREIDVNGVDHNDGRKSGYRRKEDFGARQNGRTAQVHYDAFVAQARCDQRARRPKPGKLAKSQRLRDGRGHEKAPAGGQVEVSSFGQEEYPPRVRRVDQELRARSRR